MSQRRDARTSSRHVEARHDVVHDLDDIRRRALILMDELGTELAGRSLRSLGWTFQFDRARRRLGMCKWKRKGVLVKVLSLSRHYALHGGWEIMEDVVRHEIAHALDYEIRGRSDHGPRWRCIALLTQADPTRLYEGGIFEDNTSKYVGTCPECGREQSFYRRIKRSYGCPECCRAFNSGRYSPRFKLRIVERASGREATMPAY